MLESHVEHMETESAMPKGQDKFQHQDTTAMSYRVDVSTMTAEQFGDYVGKMFGLYSIHPAALSCSAGGL